MMSPEHIAHPYPTELEKAKIMQDTGIELKQLTNWFVNNRKRFWKPRVEAKLRDQHVQKTLVPRNPPNIQRNGSIVSLVDLVAGSARGQETASQPIKSTRVTTLIPPTIRDATMVSPVSTRIVSEHNSVVSSSDSMDSSDDDEVAVQGQATAERELMMAESFKTESITVHILRPPADKNSNNMESLPQLSDVTILSNVPRERILRSYENCALTYRFTDPTKATSRRDAEIVRVKKHYLAFYLSGLRQEQAETNNSNKRALVLPTTTSDVCDILEAAAVTSVVTPRRKFRRTSVDLWKEACQTANNVYDQELPSLEEATQLFGYAS
jgi:Homeobox KN domain